LVNHLKSKGYGGWEDSNEKRKRQAGRIKVIYDRLVAAGETRIAVVGDFNDTPDSDPLAPLLEDTDLQDIFEHPDFDNGGMPGTYGRCSAASSKIDYILLSPALVDVVITGGVNRSGIWGGANGDAFPHIPQVTKASESASDHAAVWVDLNI
jgi:endonuclease/exonuclease/phosphatase family metal-dependent hydrolase